MTQNHCVKTVSMRSSKPFTIQEDWYGDRRNGLDYVLQENFINHVFRLTASLVKLCDIQSNKSTSSHQHSVLKSVIPVIPNPLRIDSEALGGLHDGSQTFLDPNGFHRRVGLSLSSDTPAIVVSKTSHLSCLNPYLNIMRLEMEVSTLTQLRCRVAVHPDTLNTRSTALPDAGSANSSLAIFPRSAKLRWFLYQSKPNVSLKGDFIGKADVAVVIVLEAPYGRLVEESGKR
jgi:hypothetical protein